MLIAVGVLTLPVPALGISFIAAGVTLLVLSTAVCRAQRDEESQVSLGLELFNSALAAGFGFGAVYLSALASIAWGSTLLSILIGTAYGVVASPVLVVVNECAKGEI